MHHPKEEELDRNGETGRNEDYRTPDLESSVLFSCYVSAPLLLMSGVTGATGTDSPLASF